MRSLKNRDRHVSGFQEHKFFIIWKKVKDEKMFYWRWTWINDMMPARQQGARGPADFGKIIVVLLGQFIHQKVIKGNPNVVTQRPRRYLLFSRPWHQYIAAHPESP